MFRFFLRARFTSFKVWLARRNPLLGLFSSFDPILHASPWRLRLLGFTLLVGHPISGWIWVYSLVMPYENLWLRISLGVLGSLMMLPFLTKHIDSLRTRLIVSLIIWIEFPFFHSWMYLCNFGNYVFLSVTCTVILVYYHITEWRIATAGTILGFALSWVLYNWLNPDTINSISYQFANLVVIGFSWFCAILLGISSANLKRARLIQTLNTISVMANELQAPLATIGLIGDALKYEACQRPEKPRPIKIEKMAKRLHVLVRNINFHLNSQIANAKLLQLPQYNQHISAQKLVSDAIDKFPFYASKQRECVQIIVHDDFFFRASYSEFIQVLKNLLKNSFTSLRAANSQYMHGAVCIEVGCFEGFGRISMTDLGMGISHSVMPNIFKPFYSFNQMHSHGLGLPFCQQVVMRAGGYIVVTSEYAMGATFTIELPLINLNL